MSAQAPQKPVTKTIKGHTQTIARQILSEPLEVLKTASDQLAGQENIEQATENLDVQQNQSQSKSQEEILEKKRKDQSQIQAFQNELQEIKYLQDQREQERRELRLQEEKLKKQKEAQQKQNNPFLEQIGKVKRGLLGGAGKMLGIKRKQRSTELVKTPSN